VHRWARCKSAAAPVYVTNPLHNRKLGERWHLRRSVLRSVITRYYYQSPLAIPSTLGFCMRLWQAAASFLLMSIYSRGPFIDMAKPRHTRLSQQHNKLGTRAECIGDRWRQPHVTIIKTSDPHENNVQILALSSQAFLVFSHNRSAIEALIELLFIANAREYRSFSIMDSLFSVKFDKYSSPTVAARGIAGFRNAGLNERFSRDANVRSVC